MLTIYLCVRPMNIARQKQLQINMVSAFQRLHPKIFSSLKESPSFTHTEIWISILFQSRSQIFSDLRFLSRFLPTTKIIHNFSSWIPYKGQNQRFRFFDKLSFFLKIAFKSTDSAVQSINASFLNRFQIIFFLYQIIL